MNQTIIGIVRSKDKNEVLAIKRRDVAIWVWPGGGLDQGERPEEGVIREIEEETGLQVRVIRKVAELSPTNRLTKLVHLYECEAEAGELKTGEETANVGFFPIDQLPQPFFHIHEIWLQDLLRNEKEIIYRPLTEVSWTRLFLYFLRHPIRVLRCFLSLKGIPINSHQEK